MNLEARDPTARSYLGTVVMRVPSITACHINCAASSLLFRLAVIAVPSRILFARIIADLDAKLICYRISLSSLLLPLLLLYSVFCFFFLFLSFSWALRFPNPMHPNFNPRAFGLLRYPVLAIVQTLTRTRTASWNLSTPIRRRRGARRSAPPCRSSLRCLAGRKASSVRCPSTELAKK